MLHASKNLRIEDALQEYNSTENFKKTSSSDFFRYEQKKYYICETAGPGRFLFGQKSLTRKNYSLEPLIIN